MRVLVVEDDRRLTRLIAGVLEDAGMVVDVAHDGDAGVEMALRGVYDVAMIDWMLPGRDGPAICRAVRAARLPTALLMLTARAQVEDRVQGLDSGADDYLTKPFAFEELLARLRALGRRFAVSSSDPSELRLGDVVMDLRALTARRGERRLDLSRTEWELLEYLVRHPRQTMSRGQILDHVWSYDSEVLPTQVDVYVSYLRRKMHQEGVPDPIKTVRGVGYRLDPDDPG